MIDLDNTFGNRAEAVAAWAERFCNGHELPEGTAAWILAADNDGYSARADVFTAIRSRYGLCDPIEELLGAYRADVIALAAPTEGALECLAALRLAGHIIAIVSNGSTKQQHGKIDLMGLRDMVDAVIVSGDSDIKKPDPASLKLPPRPQEPLSKAHGWWAMQLRMMSSAAAMLVPRRHGFIEDASGRRHLVAQR